MDEARHRRPESDTRRLRGSEGQDVVVCSANLQNKGEATAAMALDVKNGTPKGTSVLPGDGTLCNDIAVAADGQFISPMRVQEALLI
jgi:hypothetical protein